MPKKYATRGKGRRVSCTFVIPVRQRTYIRSVANKGKVSMSLVVEELLDEAINSAGEPQGKREEVA